MEESTKIEITKEDLENLTTEEIVDLKVRLEELLMECDELLEENE